MYTINDHIECCRIDSLHANGKSDSICFIRESIRQIVITSKPTLIQETDTNLETIEICVENIKHIGIYASPKFPVKNLCRYIEYMANANNYNIFIGDFDINELQIMG